MARKFEKSMKNERKNKIFLSYTNNGNFLLNGLPKAKHTIEIVNASFNGKRFSIFSINKKVIKSTGHPILM